MKVRSQTQYLFFTRCGLMYRVMFCVLTLLCSGSVFSQAINVAAGDVAGLRNAIMTANENPNLVTVINLAPGDYIFSDMGLPDITGDVIIRGAGQSGTTPTSRLIRQGATEPFRLVTARGDRRTFIQNVEIRGFSAMGDGGAILVTEDAFFVAIDSVFRNNSASGNGGAVSITGAGAADFNRNLFDGNAADQLGGAVDHRGTGFFEFDNNINQGNEAGIFGCDINYNSPGATSGRRSEITGNVFSGGCEAVSLENPAGNLALLGNTYANGSNAIDSTSDALSVFGNIFAGSPPQKLAAKNLCDDFGTGAIQSLGCNISQDASCPSNGPGDQSGVDPLISSPDNNGVISLLAGSPAIDACAETLPSFGDMVCGYRDARGLGRPQDADGDGQYECDPGAYEVQGGPDIGAAQSGAFFDATRNGEGVFVEMLDGGEQALVTLFSFAADGSGPIWLIGIGRVVGNSIVVDDILITSGGVFGAGFDPDDIVRTPTGGLSLVFSNCNAEGAPGRLSFVASGDSPFESLITRAQRLSTIVPCSGAVPVMSGRSGSFFDPARDGEGVFVQWLPNGQVVLIWYTYDPQGNQFWTISGDVTVNGNAVTANMLYPAGATSFGSQFDPAEVDLQPWGTITLQYQPGCNDIAFGYNSTVAGFGAGNYGYSRLTNLDGTTCDL